MFAHERRRLARFGQLCPRGKYEKLEVEDKKVSPASSMTIESKRVTPTVEPTPKMKFPSFSRNCDCWEYEVTGECWCPSYLN